MSQTIIPIKGRHIPYRLDNGDVIIQNNIILIIDQLDNTICACENTKENLILLDIIPASLVESVPPTCTISDCEQSVDPSEQSVDPSKTKKSGKKWSRDATLFLIDQWQKNSSKFACTTIRNEEVWKTIVKELEDAGFTGYTWKQAEDKWKNVRKGYMKVKDNQGEKSSGAEKITCKFYEELDDIFRSSPSVQPLRVASSLKRREVKSPVNQTFNMDESDSDLDNAKDELKKKKTKLQKDTYSWVSMFIDNANAKEAACEQRHKETLHTLNRVIDCYEAQMQKLIDKLSFLPLILVAIACACNLMQ